jgi:hypothetical protein
MFKSYTQNLNSPEERRGEERSDIELTDDVFVGF